MKKYLTLIVFAALSSVTVTSCYSPDPYVRHGRATGAAVGAGVGAVIGNNIDGGNSWGGAAVGAAVGGLAGDRRGKVNSMYYRSNPYRYY